MFWFLGFAIVASQNSAYVNSGTCRRSSKGKYQKVYDPQTVFPVTQPAELGQGDALYFGPLTTTFDISSISYSLNANKATQITVLWISDSSGRCPSYSRYDGRKRLTDASSFDIYDSGTWIFALIPSLSPRQTVEISSIDFSVPGLTTTPHETTPSPTTSLPTLSPTTNLPSLSPSLPADACIDKDGNRENIIGISENKALAFAEGSQHLNLTHLFIYLGPMHFSANQLLFYSIAQKGLPSGWSFVLYFEESGKECPSNQAGSFQFNLPPDQTSGNLTLDAIPEGNYILGLSISNSQRLLRRLLRELDVIIESIKLSVNNPKRNDSSHFKAKSWMIWAGVGALVACLAFCSCIYGCTRHIRTESEGGFGTYLVVEEEIPEPNAPPPANHEGTDPPPLYDFEAGSARISNATTNSLSAAQNSESYMRSSFHAAD